MSVTGFNAARAAAEKRVKEDAEKAKGSKGKPQDTPQDKAPKGKNHSK